MAYLGQGAARACIPLSTTLYLLGKAAVTPKVLVRVTIRKSPLVLDMIPRVPVEAQGSRAVVEGKAEVLEALAALEVEVILSKGTRRYLERC